jgi:hypothetical protein
LSICATAIVIGAGSNDGTIHVWDARSLREVAALPQTNIVYAATPLLRYVHNINPITKQALRKRTDEYHA